MNMAGKNRHNTPIWCDENNYAGILLTSMKAYANASGEMPTPRNLSGIEKLSPRLNEQALFDRFMNEFGGGNSQEFTDVIGSQLLVDRSLFEDLKGNWKIMKGERAPWLLYTAVNIKTPDEIWLEPGTQGGNDRLYYLSRFDIGKKGLMACLAVFERKQGVLGLWSGRTNYATTQFGYMDRKRGGEIDGHLKYWRWE